MRLENLKTPFLSMKVEDRIKLVEAIQQDRLVDKRGLRKGSELIKEFAMLSGEERKKALEVG